MILNPKAFPSSIYDVAPTLVSPSTEGAIDKLRVVSRLTSAAAGLATSETSSRATQRELSQAFNTKAFLFPLYME